MKKILDKNFKMNASILIFIILLSLAIFSLVGFMKTSNDKLLSLLGSLGAGLIVAIIQFIIAFQGYRQHEKLKKLKLIRVMYNRDDRNFYEKYISKANRIISVMGVTTLRFFIDFADYELSATKNSKILLQKLGQGIKVKILIPDIEFLKESKKYDFEKIRQHVESIKNRYPDYGLSVRYFKHIPSHSIFIVDDTCIVGPVFPNVESKHTPALQLKNSSPIAIEYLKYFDEEWNNAHE